MPRLFLISLLAGAAASAPLAPALADAPGGLSRPGHASAWEHPSRARHQAWRRGGTAHAPARRDDAGPDAAHALASPMDAAAASGHASLVELREPYLPRGIVYNVPPEPVFAASRAVIRARY